MSGFTTISASPPGGISDAIWLKPIVDIAPFGAVFKPIRCSHPVAAREKIAADLGFDLGIPVAPVMLCDSRRESDKRARFGCEQGACCVSLVTHPSAAGWQAVFTESILSSPVGDMLRNESREPLSRIAAFDLWIDNPDRANSGNMLYADSADETPLPGICAFDHDLAMGGSKGTWRNDGWRPIMTVPFPDLMRPLLEKEAMLRMAQVIQRFPDEQIRACVTRIPNRYMSDLAKKDTVNGLLGRKQLLPAFVLQYL
jgi:hypothetical protein